LFSHIVYIIDTRERRYHNTTSFIFTKIHTQIMWLLRRQGQQRWQHTIIRSRVASSLSTTVCDGTDIVAAAIRPLSLNSTSTLQNYNDVSFLQHVITRSNLIQSRIYPQHYQLYISNSFVHNCSANSQLRWFTSGGRHTHHGGRGRGNDRGRGHRSTNRIPNMKEFNTLDDAIEVYFNNLDKLTPRNLSSFWSTVPRLLRHQQRGVNLVPQLEAIFHKTADQIHSYGPKDLATTTFGFAKTIQTLQRSKRMYSSGSYEGYLHGILVRQRDVVFDFITRTVAPILYQFKPRDLKDLAYVYALLEYVPKQLDDGSSLFNHIAEKSIPLLNKFKPQELANTVWAFEKVKVSHPTLYERVGDHIITLNNLNDFTPQALANILIAYAKAEIFHPDLYENVADHIVTLNHLHDFDSQALANIIWSYAKAEVSHPELFNKVGDHIVTRQQLNDFKPQDLSNIVYSYAKAGVIRQDLFTRIGYHIVAHHHLSDFNPQKLSNTVWAYAKLGISHPDLFNKVADHIVTLNHLNDFNSQNLSNILYAYARAEISHPDLFNKVADHIVLLDNLDDYTAQAICNLAWAYHKAGIIRQDLNNKLRYAADNGKEEFSSRQLNNLYQWTSEEEDIQIQNQEDDEQNEDESGSLLAVVDEDNDNDTDKEEEKEEYNTSSAPEDLSLLTVVQLKDRLRNLGLRVSGRKQELIDRLNDHIQGQ